MSEEDSLDAVIRAMAEEEGRPEPSKTSMAVGRIVGWLAFVVTAVLFWLVVRTQS